ncbi:unnamed protein product [Bemisia tabaci]|uniref:Delta(24)-sterol reductase n=1 Tax=Bemisia tabaci TaxID=7038 RepID=A0A9P0ABC3_BEMTA|nr:unnamed protein product [Bemisia tabaci]
MFSETTVEYIFAQYRWVVVCLFLLPATFVYEIGWLFRRWYILYTQQAPKNHPQKVNYVQNQVKERNRSHPNLPMCTARPGWQSMTLREPKYKKTMYLIEVDLKDIIKIDENKQTVTVEPLVTMGQLTRTLNANGWSIPVVIELDDVTVGGAVMGQGVESMSHTYGLFQHICLSYEIVVSDGSVITCSKGENSDLYYSIPWSYGTLGFLTAVEIQMIPVTSFIKLQYHPVHSLDDMVRTYEKALSTEAKNDFVETLVFTSNTAVVMTGTFVKDAPFMKQNRIGLWYKPWFFTHVQKFLKWGPGYEYIPLRDYYHRHTRSLFWEIGDIVPFGNNPYFRFFLGWLMPPKVSFLKLTQTDVIKRLYDKFHMVEDFLVPLKTLKECLIYFESKVNIYPIWLCAFKLPNDPGLLHPTGEKEELFVDIGLYGEPKVKHYDSVKTTKDMELFVGDKKGYKMLYAGTHLTQAEFRMYYDHSLYDRQRKLYNAASAFSEIYDKVNRKVRD